VENTHKTMLLGSDAFAGWLIPRSGKQAGQIFVLKDVNVIGADAKTCHVFLDEDHVSSRHAQLAWKDGIWIIKDLGSTNGTMVAGDQLPSGERFEGLQDGDVLTFGTLEVTFKCA
jgi:pSer/pThr/pTyr-binding forkhead associated (FHA) protein